MTTVSKLACPPRFGTPRTAERETLGPAVAEVAARLGKPLMPWQAAVLDVALEIDPDTGRLAYSELGLTVPRQSGKSTLVLAKAVHRASATGFFGPRQRLVYTAQTRNKAREKWEEDYAADLKASKTFGPRVRPHFGNGNEHIRFQNGSRFGIEANTEKAGHGGTIDEAYIDEAFAQIDNRLEQAFRPAMITRPNTQLVWVSTAGWADGSPYLAEKVRRGRDQVEMGFREGLCYFEWSAPDGAHIDDRDVWRGCMPALGIVRADGSGITESAIAAELAAMEPNDFRRAYLNQWVPKDDPGTETALDVALWPVLEDVPPERPSPVAFGIEVSKDRKWGSIGLAGRRPDGLVHVQIVQAGRGTAWIPSRLAELVKAWKPVGVALLPNGPAGPLLAPIASAGVDVTKLSTSDFARACGAFTTALVDSALRHQGQNQLNLSVGAARKQRAGDSWVFNSSEVDIAPLKAVTLALHALQNPSKKRTGNVW